MLVIHSYSNVTHNPPSITLGAIQLSRKLLVPCNSKSFQLDAQKWNIMFLDLYYMIVFQEKLPSVVLVDPNGT